MTPEATPSAETIAMNKRRQFLLRPVLDCLEERFLLNAGRAQLPPPGAPAAREVARQNAPPASMLASASTTTGAGANRGPAGATPASRPSLPAGPARLTAAPNGAANSAGSARATAGQTPRAIPPGRSAHHLPVATVVAPKPAHSTAKADAARLARNLVEERRVHRLAEIAADWGKHKIKPTSERFDDSLEDESDRASRGHHHKLGEPHFPKAPADDDGDPKPATSDDDPESSLDLADDRDENVVDSTVGATTVQIQIRKPSASIKARDSHATADPDRTTISPLPTPAPADSSRPISGEGSGAEPAPGCLIPAPTAVTGRRESRANPTRPGPELG